MIPLRVSAENIATYGTLEWEIPEGLTSVLGRNEMSDGADSNGAGKTTLLSMIPIALFGPPLPWSEYLAKGEETCRLELEFEHGDETYRVRRTFSGKGRGKTMLDFERFVDSDPEDNWESLTQESQSETQALIVRTIGLSEETFGHSVFAAQGARHFASPELQPRERKAVLAETLGLDTWDALLELVRADIRTDETEAAALTIRLGDLEAEQESEADLEVRCAAAMLVVLSATDTLTDAESTHETARKHLAEAEQAAKECEGLQREVDRFVARAAEAETARSEAVALSATLDDLVHKSTNLQVLETELREREALEASRAAVADNHRQALARVQELRQQAKASRELGLAFAIRGKELKTRRDDLAAKGTGVCNECGQSLAGEALETALAAMDAELKILRDQLVATTTEATEKEDAATEAANVMPPEPEPPAADLDLLRQLIADARQAALSLAAGRERLAGLERLTVLDESFVDEMSAAKTALAAAAGVDPARLAVLQQTVDARHQDLVLARDTLQRVQQEQTRLEERLRSVAAAAERHKDALAARARLLTRLDLLKALEAAYGRNGIPALILETSAIPQLEAEAQRILSELGVPYRIELVTQRETKSGTLKDTLDVVVHEPAGARRYETYSGGEQTRLEFALRIALARLVSSRSGNGSGLLCLDEMPFLDGSGMAQVANVLRGLDEFRSILLVSHDDRMSDSFDQQLVVVRDEDGSRLEEVTA